MERSEGEGQDKAPTIRGRVSRVTKTDAARRQLDTAIRLFFSHGDAVAIGTLAYNALEIGATLARQQGKREWTAFEDLEEEFGKPAHELHQEFHAPRNFFKHADRDPEVVLEGFDDSVAEYLLFFATIQFGEIAERSLEMWVMLVWFFAVNDTFETPAMMKPVVDEFLELRGMEPPRVAALRPQVFAHLMQRGASG